MKVCTGPAIQTNVYTPNLETVDHDSLLCVVFILMFAQYVLFDFFYASPLLHNKVPATIGIPSW